MLPMHVRLSSFPNREKCIRASNHCCTLYFPNPCERALNKSDCVVSPDRSHTATPRIPACFAKLALRLSDCGSSYVTTWFVYGETKNGVLEQVSQNRVNPPYPTNVEYDGDDPEVVFAGTSAP